MEEEERNQVKEDLDQRERELKKAQQEETLAILTTRNEFILFSRKEQDLLKLRLAGLERKILVGGENLLEKAEEQERLLEESAQELEERKRHEQQLRDAINQKEVKWSQKFNFLI